MSTPPNIYVAVVDDDESYCRSLGRLLRVADYQPVTYASAEAFLADTRHPRFDCVLIDVQLGGISGLELHRRLAALGSRVPVIYVTSHDDPATRIAAQAVGCFAFMSKIEPSDALLDAIQSAVRSRTN